MFYTFYSSPLFSDFIILLIDVNSFLQQGQKVEDLHHSSKHLKQN